MDIDDLLQNLQPSIQNVSSPQTLLSLTRVYTSERLSPEILPYPHALLKNITTLISERIAEIEELESTPQAGGGLRSVILQMDLERWKWLVRAFLRVRLAKLSRFGVYYLSLPNAGEPNGLLHASEMAFLRAHQDLLADHYGASFLSGFPEALRGLDDTRGGISMVDAPELKKAVFIRVLASGDGGYADRQTTRDRWNEGDVWVLRYEDIKGALERGEVELI
jgi:GINS complex subunit 4